MKALLLVIVLLLIAAAAISLALLDGGITLRLPAAGGGWWRVSLGYPAAAGILALAFLFFYACLRIMHQAFSLPRQWQHYRDSSRQRGALKQLDIAVLALAHGRYQQAGKAAKAAGKALPDLSAPLVLQARAAELGKAKASELQTCYAQLLDRQDTAFVGTLGMMRLATNAHDKAQSLHLARQAYAMQPHQPETVHTLATLLMQTGDWQEAQHLLFTAEQQRTLPKEEAQRLRMLAILGRAQAAHSAGDHQEAFYQARRALKLNAAFTPALLLYGSYLSKTAPKKAAAFWEKHLRRQADTPRVQAYRALAEQHPNLQKRIEKFLAVTPVPFDVLENQPWSCVACQATTELWQPVCQSCGSVDTLHCEDAAVSNDSIMHSSAYPVITTPKAE